MVKAAISVTVERGSSVPVPRAIDPVAAQEAGEFTSAVACLGTPFKTIEHTSLLLPITDHEEFGITASLSDRKATRGPL